MKEEVKETKKEEETPKITAGYIGKYVVSFSNKGYSFEFPVENSLEQNLACISYLKEEIVKALAENERREKEKKKEVKEEKK